MRSYIITLPRGYQVDIFHLPEDFDELIRKAFAEYTEGTAKDYTYVDKLGFIDRCVDRIANNLDADDAVEELVLNRVRYEYRENGSIIDAEDVYCQEFMWDCYDKGSDSARLNQHYKTDDHHIYDEIQKVMVRIIKIVINWEDDGNERP